MSIELDEIITRIEAISPLHAKKVRKTLALHDKEFITTTNAFLARYEAFLLRLNRNIDFAITCYLNMIDDMYYETIQFLKTGAYSCVSFSEVNQCVYDRPEVMENYVHGLMLSQFLWRHHYCAFSFFKNILARYNHSTQRYLEIGAGHGLYVSEALKILDENTRFDILDISPTSLHIAQEFIEDNRRQVSYILSDIFQYQTRHTYDFITLGEVLEHVEKPRALLEKMHTFLCAQGHLFITVPANAPAIDHIYLFSNADEIREMIRVTGFSIIEEMVEYAEDAPKLKAGADKRALLYAALLVAQ